MSIQLPEIPEPVNPPVGQWEFFIDTADQQLKLKNSTGVVVNLTSLNVNVFGSEFQEVSEDSITTTTGTGFINKVTLNTSNLPAGNYMLKWNYQWNYDDGANDFRGLVRNNTTAEDYMEHRQEPKDTGGTGPGGSDQRHQNSGFIIRSLTGVNEIVIDYAAGSGGVTTAIWNARLALWRVS